MSDTDDYEWLCELDEGDRLRITEPGQAPVEATVVEVTVDAPTVGDNPSTCMVGLKKNPDSRVTDMFAVESRTEGGAWVLTDVAAKLGQRSWWEPLEDADVEEVD